MLSAKPQPSPYCQINDPIYRGFIEENQKLLNEVSDLKAQIKILSHELNQYQKLSIKITQIIRSREVFGVLNLENSQAPTTFP